MRECIDEGVLQSYLDGELSQEMAAKVEAHASRCNACAEAMDEAANEMAMFTSAFEPMMTVDVPTVSLRERIDRAIAAKSAPVEISEREQSRSFSGWLASFSDLFKVSPQRAIGFASLIAVVAFAAIFATIHLRQSGNNGSNINTVAVNNKPNDPTPNATATPSPAPNIDNPSGGTDGEQKGKPGNRNPQKKQPKKEVLVPEPNQLQRDELAVNTYKPLPGEQQYLKAIDSLTTEIQASDSVAMKPSLRAEYERNLAVLDHAIDSTRRVARRNPNDPDAVQFLYSSYQSKLDLLTAVAEQVRPTIATR
ncbi:MAG: zf-HC2 domain-containing protein [Acidobacteriota bacterium]|nr:zf-HC2 domain-containing protein [Acidobacteriota bacterium]